MSRFKKISPDYTNSRFAVTTSWTCGGGPSEPLPEYIQLELDFLDEMFERRIEDKRA